MKVTLFPYLDIIIQRSIDTLPFGDVDSYPIVVDVADTFPSQISLFFVALFSAR